MSDGETRARELFGRTILSVSNFLQLKNTPAFSKIVAENCYTDTDMTAYGSVGKVAMNVCVCAKANNHKR